MRLSPSNAYPLRAFGHGVKSQLLSPLKGGQLHLRHGTTPIPTAIFCQLYPQKPQHSSGLEFFLPPSPFGKGRNTS